MLVPAAPEIVQRIRGLLARALALDVTGEDLARGGVLAGEGTFDGPTPPLTSSEALDLADLAALVADTTGRPARRSVIPDEALHSGMTARGIPSAVADIAVGLYRASRERELSTADPTQETLLGRPPIAMRDVIAQASRA